ncbi:MAG TPA: AAA family ATPase, partial [Actinomycetota bacterium]
MRTCPRCGTENPPEANFCLWCGAALRARIGAEERKIITVLFCDLQGFTAAAEQRDPEEVGATLRRYHAVTKSLIEGHGGTVEKFLGDGVIGVFGMPVSHEDDPERAIRAALRIVDAAAEATSGLGRSLPVRIGVTTGEALVSTVPGEQVGGSIAGDVVNTAARLQAAAPPNGILVADATHRATAGDFVYEPHEPIRAKGKLDPITVWRPLRARGRIGVDRDQPDTPFVGRGKELAQLREAFTAAVGTPAVTTVYVSGDAGIGKSRLVREFSTYIEELPDLVRWRRGRCLPYGEGVRFWAIAEIVKAEAGILDTDDPAATANALRQAIEALDVSEAERGWLPQILSPLLGLPGPTTTPSREELFAGIRRFLAAMATERPTVLVLEDLQWADDAMLELLSSLDAELSGMPLLLLGVTRIEIEDRHPGWLDARTGAVRIGLDVVSDDESRSLIRALLAEQRLPDDAEDALVARAGGNPLFAEEFVRMLRDRGDVAPGSAADLPMPESLRALAVARLDALPPDLKSLVHDASVVGRVFWPGAVAAVGDADPGEVEARVPFLLRRRLIERHDSSSIEGEAELAFRHDVTIRVAYEQIPRAARARKHRNAADWVRRIGGGRVAEVAEEIAHHLEQALALTTGDDHELRSETAEAQTLVASHLDALDAPGAVRAYERALELMAPDAPTRPTVLVRAAAAAEAVGRFDDGDAWYRGAIDGFEAANDPRQLGETLGLLGRSLMMQGRIDEADAVFGRAVTTLDALPPGQELARVCARLAGRSFVTGDYGACLSW